jgi:hypothetical protein
MITGFVLNHPNFPEKFSIIFVLMEFNVHSFQQKALSCSTQVKIKSSSTGISANLLKCERDKMIVSSDKQREPQTQNSSTFISSSKSSTPIVLLSIFISRKLIAKNFPGQNFCLTRLQT